MPSKVEYTCSALSELDILTLARDLREVEQVDVLRTFVSVEEAVRQSWAVSEYTRCIRLFGEPLATFGVVREDGYGVPWMLTVDLASFAHPVTCMREARKQFELIKQRYPVLHNIVPVEDTEACSLLESLGFEVDYEPMRNENGFDYYRFWYGRAS